MHLKSRFGAKLSSVLSLTFSRFSCRLDGKHVVFGEVIRNMELVKRIEGYGTSSGSVSVSVVIADAGVL